MRRLLISTAIIALLGCDQAEDSNDPTSPNPMTPASSSDRDGALAAAVEEGRRAGIASVTPLNCAEGTKINEAGDACEPTAEYRAAAFEEGRIAGVASVTPLNCAEGTEQNADGNACQPTAEYRAAAVEEGRQAGVASVTPLNCADGTRINDAGDACESRLSNNVIVGDGGTIEPTSDYAQQICLDAGGTFDELTDACFEAENCFWNGMCARAAERAIFTAADGNTREGQTAQDSNCETDLGWYAGRDQIDRTLECCGASPALMEDLEKHCL